MSLSGAVRRCAIHASSTDGTKHLGHGSVLVSSRTCALRQFAAVVNEKKQKLRELQQRVQELEKQAEESPDLVKPSIQFTHSVYL